MNNILNIVFTAILIFWIYSVSKIWIKSQYKYDKNGRFIFYPINRDTGYVVENMEQVEQAVNEYKKCFFFKVKEYKSDIERIFATSEVINEVLPIVIVQENQARLYTWMQLLIFLLMIMVILAIGILQKNYILAIIILPALLINLKMFKKKLSQNKKG